MREAFDPWILFASLTAHMYMHMYMLPLLLMCLLYE